MANLGPLKDLVVQLTSATTDEVKILETLNGEWQKVQTEDVSEILQNNIIFQSLAKTMEENFEEWRCAFPSWIHELTHCFFSYRNMVSSEQTRLVVASFKKYILSGCWDCMKSLYYISTFDVAPPILLEEDELYNTMRTEITKDTVVGFFINCATFEPWQKKIGEDKQFVLDLVANGSNKVWALLCNVARHPDAKVFLPNIIKETAAATSNDNYHCTRVYTLLCSDNDITKIALDIKWIEVFSFITTTLLEKGKIYYVDTWHSLVGTILPIANLSVVDSLKDELGKKTIKSLVKIVTEDKLPNAPAVTRNLLRSRQEASRVSEGT